MFLRVNNRNGLKRVIITFLVVILVTCLVVGNHVATTAAYFTDIEPASTNSAQGWSASLWTQTSQADFEAGIINQVDTSSSPNEVMLDTETSEYYTSGTLASQVLDTGVAGTTWNMLFWDETLMSNTDITFEVRASDTLFNAGDATPSWTNIDGTSPVITGLPAGRYKQWRAVLTTSDTSNTPTMHEVRLYYY